MKIVDKLAEDFICGCSTCPECHYGDNMDSFKAGYQAAVDQGYARLKKMHPEQDDMLEHMVISKFVSYLEREVED